MTLPLPSEQLAETNHLGRILPRFPMNLTVDFTSSAFEAIATDEQLLI